VMRGTAEANQPTLSETVVCDVGAVLCGEMWSIDFRREENEGSLFVLWARDEILETAKKGHRSHTSSQARRDQSNIGLAPVDGRGRSTGLRPANWAGSRARVVFAS
jgi:hypothetical protein